MYINSDLRDLRRDSTGTIIINCSWGLFIIDKSDSRWFEANEFYRKYYRTPKSARAIASYPLPSFIITPVSTTSKTAVEIETPIAPDPKDVLKEGLSALLDFFSEFDFTPSYRFTNTLAFMAGKNIKNAMQYVRDYFELMGSGYVEDVSSKVKSREFSELVKKIAQYGTPTNKVNDRFKVYFGAAGTGKTTLAQKETENRCIVCNSSMLPSDLMENFVFHDGKPDFNPSTLWECMEQGKAIVLDEINLLPFDSLRFLQGIVDGKTSFDYKGRTVTIHEGFKIIGTMNLTLGGVTYGLPEPRVDRCEMIREFKLTAEQLMGAVTGEFVAG